MVPYILLLTVPILLHPFTRETSINRFRLDRIPLFLFFAFLTVLVMLRHRNVGNDTNNYIYLFEKFANMGWSRLTKDFTEIGYKLFNKLLSLISKEPRFFLAVIGFTVSAMIYPTYRRLWTRRLRSSCFASCQSFQ